MDMKNDPITIHNFVLFWAFTTTLSSQTGLVLVWCHGLVPSVRFWGRRLFFFFLEQFFLLLLPFLRLFTPRLDPSSELSDHRGEQQKQVLIWSSVTAVMCWLNGYGLDASWRCCTCFHVYSFPNTAVIRIGYMILSLSLFFNLFKLNSKLLKSINHFPTLLLSQNNLCLQ